MSTTDALKAKVAPVAAKTQVAQTVRQSSLLDVVRSKSFKSQMSLALPKSLNADRLTRIVMTECRKTPDLLKCNAESFFGAVLQCAQLGLEPGSSLGHCYLIPFGNGKGSDGKPNAQLIIGYRGMIDLARRSGQILSLFAYCVHEQDQFSYRLGLDPDIEHIPAASADRGKVTHVYAVAKLKDGGTQFEVMSRAEIEKVRASSKAGKSGPWASHWEEMAKKTVIRRLFKYLPVSIEAVRAVEVDEKTDRGEATTTQDFLDGEYIDKGQVEGLVQEPVIQEEPQPTAEKQEPKAPLQASSDKEILDGYWNAQ